MLSPFLSKFKNYIKKLLTFQSMAVLVIKMMYNFTKILLSNCMLLVYCLNFD